ncbi:MAG: sigma-54-dependent transcriptional regulator [Dissulfurispiraceae bacterium]
MQKILIVDDEPSIRSAFGTVIKIEGYSVLEASDGKRGVEIFDEERPDAVILDLKMPGMDGIETMKKMKTIDSSIPIIIATGYGDIRTAVEAIKMGAYDFITKSSELEVLLLTLRRAIEKRELELGAGRLQKNVDESYEVFLGKSPAMKKVISQVQQVAATNFSLIIQGETGTGKSYIANMIHGLSKRSGGKFVTIDMGAIPDALAESELFGYEKGAFTGAEKRKVGMFQIANGGTILIDELQNMTPNVQIKMLRVMEEKKIIPLGSLLPVDIDVRVIAATNADLEKEVAEKKFRKDLFFRLNEMTIKLPALRDRIGDVPFLAVKFCQQACVELDKNIHEITDDAFDCLKSYHWPGNVRQLKNTMRRLVLFCSGSVIDADNIKALLGDESRKGDAQSSDDIGDITLKGVERAAIKKALALANGNKTKAASLLQIDYTTLLRKIKILNIS